MCIKVDPKQGIAKIRLSKNFYSKEAIDKAIESFKGVKISKKEEKTHFHILVKAENDIERAALEFCNLLLAIIKGSAL